MSAKQKLFTLLGTAAATGAIVLTTTFEGTVQKTYRDPINILTACRGHTGPELRMGQTFTLEQCDEMQYSDLLKHASDLDCIKTPLSDGQKAAFLSFTYNVGKQKFCTSTLVKKANSGDLVGACNEMPRWIMAGDKVLAGLVTRRQVEREICLKGVDRSVFEAIFTRLKISLKGLL